MIFIVDLANTAFVICNKDAVEFRDVGNSLWCTKAGNRVNSVALAQIENFDGVIAERTNKQSFASEIEREMVDPSFDTRQRDCLF